MEEGKPSYKCPLLSIEYYFIIDYSTKLNELEASINDLKAQKLEIENKIQRLSEQKEQLQNEYNLARIRKGPNITEWTKTKFEWSEEITKLLQERFKFNDFRSKQLAAINATLSRKDVLLLMPTGGGKSLVYQLPALVDKHITLVISPLISLIEDQLMTLKVLGIGAATVNASSSKEEKKIVHREMINQHSKINLIYVTPEWVAKSKMFMTYLQRCFDRRHLKRIVIGIYFHFF